MTVALDNGQIEIGEDGLVVGLGTDYTVGDDFFAWWGAPRVRTSDIPFASMDGALPGRDLLDPHMTNVVVEILADTEEEMGDKIDDWKNACRVRSDSLVRLRCRAFGRTRRRYGRFRIPGEVIVSGWSLVGNSPIGGPGERLVARGSAQFAALDTFTLGDDLRTGTTGRELPGAGFLVPFLVPFTLPAGTTGGITITNEGNRAAPWTARLDGPITYPEVSHTQSGLRLYLSLDANGGIDIPAGQWIDFDSQARSVLINGTADARSRLTIDSEWWDLPPGPNDFILRADAGTGTLTVSAYDAFHS